MTMVKPIVYLTCFVLAVSVAQGVAVDRHSTESRKRRDLAEEEAEFWQRFLPATQGSIAPTVPPTASPASPPTASPVSKASQVPTSKPLNVTTDAPVPSPVAPTESPISLPVTGYPLPTDVPTLAPTNSPSVPLPTAGPTAAPLPAVPSMNSPHRSPMMTVTRAPTDMPTGTPSASPSDEPSDVPSIAPSDQPSDAPSDVPSTSPSDQPSAVPSSSSPPTIMPSISAQPSPDECILEVDLECTTASGESCDDIPPPELECVCPGCVTQIGFRYTGSVCDQGNIGMNGLVNCTDFSFGPQFAVRVVIMDSSAVLYDGVIVIGGDIILSDGGDCIGPVLFVSVFLPRENLLLQELEVDITCQEDTSITLLNAFGSVQFSGYQCMGEIEQNCFPPVTFDMAASNIGETTFDLAAFTLAVNDDEADLISFADPTDLALGPGGAFLTNSSATLLACEATTYNVSTRATGRMRNTNFLCTDTDSLSFRTSDAN